MSTKHLKPKRAPTPTEVKVDKLHHLMSGHVADQTRLIDILLRRCDKQDQEIDTLTTAVVKASQRADRHDAQMDRTIALHFLILRRFERFSRAQLEPGLIASIHNDLKTPTVTDSHGPRDILDPPFANRSNV